MEMMMPILMFLGGLILVIKGGDVFVDAASGIAKAMKIPSFIIGATIVSLATTLPEMIVSGIAAVDGKMDMAIGNAIGSVTANTGLIMGVAFVFMAVLIRRQDYIKQCALLLGSVLLLWLGSLGGRLELWASVGLIVIFVSFMVLNVKNAKAEARAAERTPISKKETIINVVMFAAGAIAIAGGSQLLVNGGSAIAGLLGVPDRIIAVTLVAIGTSLPELVTTLTAIRKKQSQLSIGNIIGANIIDLTLILPLCALITGNALPVPPMTRMVDLPVCLGMIVLGIVPLLVWQKASRKQGLLMLGAYLGYLVFTV